VVFETVDLVPEHNADRKPRMPIENIDSSIAGLDGRDFMTAIS